MSPAQKFIRPRKQTELDSGLRCPVFSLIYQENGPLFDPGKDYRSERMRQKDGCAPLLPLVRSSTRRLEDRPRLLIRKA
jgi:hypothetical protein